MAAQVGGMIRDPATSENNFGEAGAGGKANMMKVQKKGGGGGLVRRKPLGEISNSLKQSSLQQTLKKQSSMGFSFIKEEAGVSNVGKKSVDKPQEKAKTAMRKPLGDISNSREVATKQTSKKSFNDNLDSITEEKCLHDHQKCIEVQKNAVDMDYFLKTVALDKDSSTRLSSHMAVNGTIKLKITSPSKFMQVEELPSELVFKDVSPQGKKRDLLGHFESSSPLCKILESPNSEWNFSSERYLEFLLTESPKVLRFD